jgi:hypothetical protein
MKVLLAALLLSIHIVAQTTGTGTAAPKRDSKNPKDTTDKVNAVLKEPRKRPDPRHISTEKQSQCSDILRRHRGIVRIMAIQNGEAYQFAKDWYSVFKAAGWEIAEDRVATALISGDPRSGILLRIHGSPVAPDEFSEVLEIPRDTPRNMLIQCMGGVLQMGPAVVRVQGSPDMPEGKVNLTVLEQP